MTSSVTTPSTGTNSYFAYLVNSGNADLYQQRSVEAVQAFIDALLASDATISSILGHILQGQSAANQGSLEAMQKRLQYLDLPAQIEKWMNAAFANNGKGLSMKDETARQFIGIAQLFETGGILDRSSGLTVDMVFGADTLKIFRDAWKSSAVSEAVQTLKRGGELTPDILTALRGAVEKLIASMKTIYREVGNTQSGVTTLDSDALASLVTQMTSRYNQMQKEYVDLATRTAN